MPTRTEFVEPEVFLVHNGQTVYRTYSDDDADRPVPYTFTLHREDTDSLAPHSFYVPDLNVPSARRLETERPDETYVRASKFGTTTLNFTRMPEYQDLREEWAKWHTETVPMILKQAVCEAIDQGILK